MSDSQSETQSLLSNKDVWSLIKTPKRMTEHVFYYNEGANHEYELKSDNKENTFVLDFNRGRIELKYTLQTRVNTSIVLIRLDINSTHTNPNVDYHVEKDDPFFSIHERSIGKRFEKESHIHVYREGFEDKWAYPINEIIKDTKDIKKTILAFLKYCNINGKITFQGDLSDYF